MAIRRERRVTVPISVRLWGLDRDGKVFSQNVKTLNIATSGARLYGVTAALERGFIVGLQCGNMRARFMVMWVGEKAAPAKGRSVCALPPMESGALPCRAPPMMIFPSGWRKTIWTPKAQYSSW